MSRWVEQFENHAFNSVWTNLKASVESAYVDDATVVTSVTELARLKKVLSFVDEMINGLDPELIPSSTWDNFNSQAVACLQQVESYNSNRNIVHIQNANANADNLLTYVRPYMVAVDHVAKSLRESIRVYASTIDQYCTSFTVKTGQLLSEINRDNDRGKELLLIIEEVSKKISRYQDKIFGSEGGDPGIESKIKLLVGEFNEKLEEINEYYNETLVGDGDKMSTKREIALLKANIIQAHEDIVAVLESVSSEVGELKRFYTRVYGNTNDTGERRGGLSDEINARVSALTDFEGKQKNRFETLNLQIESLLPGATSAGLATAYRKMKDSFVAPIAKMSKIFYGAIVFLVLFSLIFMVKEIGPYYIQFSLVTTWDEIARNLINKLPIYIPIVWLAFYASKRRSEYQRLQQEYAHKEALASSYDSYKKQIADLDDSDGEMQKAFIMKAVDAIAYNASATLDRKHGDRPPLQEIIEKTADKTIELASKANNVFGGKK